MSKKDLLLEIGTEEIPARFMADTLQQMEEIASNLFQLKRINIGSIKTYGTPRRLVLFIEGVEERQKDVEEKKKGPAKNAAFNEKGEPTKAALGFARGQGVEVEDLTVEDFQGGEYLFAIKKIAGEETFKLLPEIVKDIVTRLSFPKPMYWSSRDVRFARPIRWLLALYGDNTIPFEYAELASHNLTYGHRFIAPGPFEVNVPASYFDIMRESHVILDQRERKDIIKKQAEEAAESVGGRPLIDEDLLEEVNCLVEYPNAIVGEFSPEFLEIPQEVLITSMQSHQRYFPVVSQKDELLPYFITISNVERDTQGYVKIGNEMVLRARLADARFFFQEDQKTRPEEYVEQLKDVIFQEELGTSFDKTERIKLLSEFMADYFNLDNALKNTVSRTAYLCKFDLLTLMVDEFPELQGIMGREYARLSGESDEVANGIFEHYLPKFAGDELPQTLAGSLVSVADKTDNIVGAFGRGIQPTGSQDPYALRRQALGIVHILLNHDMSLPLTKLLEQSIDDFGTKKLKKPREEIINDALEFFRQRIRHVFLEKGLRYDLVDAVLEVEFDIVPQTYDKVKSLAEAVENPEFDNLMTAFTRAANLAKKAPSQGEVRLELLEDEAEEVLYRAFQQVNKDAVKFLQEKDYKGVLEQFSLLQKPVDDFFDQVMVMVENEELKNNRLSLLKDIRNLFLKLADFNKIVTH